jgi:hypothetical protein
MFLKNLIYFNDFQTIEINNETINLLDYCFDSRKHFSMMRIAQTLWSKEELKSHLIIEGGKYRADTTIRTPFESQVDLEKKKW